MKLIELKKLVSDICEIFSRASALPIKWAQKLNDDYLGSFKINDKSFIIEIQKTSIEDITTDARKKLLIALNKDELDFLNNKNIWRVDFAQFINNEPVYTDTNNMSNSEVLTLLSTIAHGCVDKFNSDIKDFNIIYFAAKSKKDEHNPRKNIYPKIARNMAKLVNGTSNDINADNENHITFIFKGFTLLEIHEHFCKKN